MECVIDKSLFDNEFIGHEKLESVLNTDLIDRKNTKFIYSNEVQIQNLISWKLNNSHLSHYCKLFDPDKFIQYIIDSEDPFEFRALSSDIINTKIMINSKFNNDIYNHSKNKSIHLTILILGLEKCYLKLQESNCKKLTTKSNESITFLIEQVK